MTASLTPALALAYLRQLSLDVREAVVLDPDGEPLAGDWTLAESARGLVAAGGTRSASTPALHVARTPDGGVIAVLAGDFALAPLLGRDLESVAATLVTARRNLPGT